MEILKKITWKKLLSISFILTIISGLYNSKLGLGLSVIIGKGWPYPYWVNKTIQDTFDVDYTSNFLIFFFILDFIIISTIFLLIKILIQRYL